MARDKKGFVAVLVAGLGLGGLLWWLNRKPAGASPAGAETATVHGVVSEIGTDMGGVNEIFGPGLPVQGAVVTLGGKSSAPTGIDGQYEITGLPPDVPADGEVTAPGYQDELVTITPYGGDNTLDITMTVAYFP